MRFRNNLPANNVGFGSPETSIHLHNGHTASESDGFAGDFFPSGTFKDNHYPNVLAGFADGLAPNGDPREALGTLWYHDHRVDFTAPNVYKGLAGFYFLFDNLDTGDETTGLRLPSGAFDVPLLFADKRFDSTGQLFFNQFDLNGFVGDKFTVNGKIQPFLKVARRKYRFRMLDAGPSRFYEFILSNGQQFIQIANDGNLLPKPLSRSAIRIAPAERVDVILDFSSANIGDRIFLQNRLRQDNGRGPSSRNLDTPIPILRFDVDRDAADPSQIPATLRALPPVNTSQGVTTRTWRFQNRNGAWAINDKFFDVNRVDATIKRGTAEIWVFRNEFRDWSHPIHVHLEEFQILSRNGSAPPADEVARKDVVRLRQGEEVRVFIRFRDWLGKYMMHCHNSVHEDHAMMIRFDVVP